MAKAAQAEPQHQQPHGVKAKRAAAEPAKTKKAAPAEPQVASRRPRDSDRSAAADRRTTARQRVAERSPERTSPRPPDRYIGVPQQDFGAIKVIGQREVGSAAWYGLVGQRTANGESLDTIRATAAHRSLPLNSLARVTNLKNGRSVIVRVTDRGPVSHNFVIDLSPRAADELDMRRAGVAPVAIDPVVSVAQTASH